MIQRKHIISFITAAAFIIFAYVIGTTFFQKEEKHIKAGFLYVGDAGNAYTNNFLKAQTVIEETFSENVETLPLFNIQEGDEAEALEELIENGCDIIFGTSYGYEETFKEFARQNPGIEFCMAAGDNAQTEPVSNYHTFMGHVYEGRYISGLAAGMKLRELINEGVIGPEEAKIGYVGAFQFAEVISGYTAFFLGVRSVCPEATMKVVYTNSWSDYTTEKRTAEQLLNEGCILISQHSDTKGPAVACENYQSDRPVLHVGYNKNMKNVAPTTSLTGCRVNWEPYMVEAVRAVLEDRKIESVFEHGITVNGNDVGAGISMGWVSMLEINELLAAEGTDQAVRDCIDGFKHGKIHVFSGDYRGVNLYDENDIIDLSQAEYRENAGSSAPGFCYLIEDIEVDEYAEQYEVK